MLFCVFTDGMLICYNHNREEEIYHLEGGDWRTHLYFLEEIETLFVISLFNKHFSLS